MFNNNLQTFKQINMIPQKSQLELLIGHTKALKLKKSQRRLGKI